MKLIKMEETSTYRNGRKVSVAVKRTFTDHSSPTKDDKLQFILGLVMTLTAIAVALILGLTL